MPTKNDINKELAKRIKDLFNNINKDKTKCKVIDEKVINKRKSEIAGGLSEIIEHIFRDIDSDLLSEEADPSKHRIALSGLTNPSSGLDALLENDMSESIGLDNYFYSDGFGRNSLTTIVHRLLFYEHYYLELADFINNTIRVKIDYCFTNLCLDSLGHIEKLTQKINAEKGKKARAKGRTKKKQNTTIKNIIYSLINFTPWQLLDLAAQKPFTRAKIIQEVMEEAFKDTDVKVPHQKTIHRNWDEVWAIIKAKKKI